MRIVAAIFDMDGLLIDSEPFWQAAEVAVLGAAGVPLTPEMCFKTVGLRVEEAVAYWRERYPWDGPDTQQLADEIVRRVSELVAQHGEPQSGAPEAVELLHGRGLPLAVATSSRLALAETVLDKLEIRRFFGAVCCAQPPLRSKPHPDVYLAAASELNVDPTQCLAFEDSGAGVISAKAAGMTVVAVPFHGWRDDDRLRQADVSLDSLSQFTVELLNLITGVDA